MKRWLLISQMAFLAVLAAAAVSNSVNDHGVLMAINCFCIGIVFMCIVSSAMINHTLNSIAQHEAMVAALSKALSRAIQEGRIEVIPLVATDDHRDPNTLH